MRNQWGLIDSLSMARAWLCPVMHMWSVYMPILLRVILNATFAAGPKQDSHKGPRTPLAPSNPDLQRPPRGRRLKDLDRDGNRKRRAGYLSQAAAATCNAARRAPRHPREAPRHL